MIGTYHVYDIIRRGRWIRQIVAHDAQDAQRWVEAFLPGATAILAY